MGNYRTFMYKGKNKGRKVFTDEVKEIYKQTIHLLPSSNLKSSLLIIKKKYNII